MAELIVFQNDTMADAEQVNFNFEELADRIGAGTSDLFGQNDATTMALQWGHKGGRVRNGSTVTTVAAGTIALTPSATNYVEVDTATGVVSTNTSGFTSTRQPLRRLVTDATSVTTNTDSRTFFAYDQNSGGGGGGGTGHTIKDEGISLSQRTGLNFKGDSVVATDDAAGDETEVTINHLATAVHTAAQPVNVLKGGADDVTGSGLNFIEGSNIAFTVALNGDTGNVDVTIDSTAGTLEWRGNWATATAYAIDDVVQSGTRKSSYRCKVANTSGAATEPGAGASWATYWTLIAQAGETGATGATGAAGADGADGSPGLVPKGDWSSVTLYVAGDVVQNSGSAFVAIGNTVNNEPPNATYWDLLASKGDTGPQGPQGTQGIQGPAGLSLTVLESDGTPTVADVDTIAFTGATLTNDGGGNVTVGITPSSVGAAASSHTHSIANVTGLQTELDGKAASTHTHTASDVTNFSEAVDDRVNSLLVEGTNVTLTYDDNANTLTIDASGGGGGGASDLDDLTDVVITTPGSGDFLQHNGTNWVNDTIAISDVTNLSTTLDGKADDVHSHAISDVTGLQTELTDLATDIDGKADDVHSHAISDVTGLQAGLDGKADDSHTHSASDVTSGTLDNARLSTQVARKDVANTFVQNQVVENQLYIFAEEETDGARLSLKTAGTIDGAGGSGRVAFIDNETLAGQILLASHIENGANNYFGAIAYTDRDGNKLPIRFWTHNAANEGKAALYLGAGDEAGRIGIGNIIDPTASLHLPAGTTAAGSAPLKFKITNAALLSVVENGTFEVDSSGNLYYSKGGVRYYVNLNTDSNTTVPDHNHTASDVTDFDESVDDRVSTLLTEGTGITLTYDDNAGTLTIDATGGGGGGGGASELDDLSDVVITTPADGHIIRHNGTEFVNTTIGAADLPATIDAAKIADGSVSNAEFQRLDGVTSSIQTQLNTKAGTTTANTFTAVQTFTQQYYSDDFDLGDISGNVTIDWDNGNVQYGTLTGNVTFTFNNIQNGGRYVLILKQDATGSRTATWPTTKWPSGIVPVLTTTAGKEDILSFVRKGGSTYGAYNLNF